MALSPGDSGVLADSAHLTEGNAIFHLLWLRPIGRAVSTGPAQACGSVLGEHPTSWRSPRWESRVRIGIIDRQPFGGGCGIEILVGGDECDAAGPGGQP